jgi:2-C-methyl-D-erythritol 4-phosphate cytidylyltransferase
MFDLVLLMAGMGTRTNLVTNKVFYEIDGIPLFMYSLNKFKDLKECDKIILVVRDDELSLVEHLASDRIIITTGGKMRQDSVYNGIKNSTNEIVLIHDAARYNIDMDEILAVYQATLKSGGAVLAAKVSDTIKEVVNNKIIKTLDRTNLWAMQTPQGVKRSVYLKAIQYANINNYYGTDDVELLEKYTNIVPVIVEGKANNFKLTTNADIKLAEIIIRGKNNV